MNRRSLKKNIRYTCGDIAGECIFASHIIPDIDLDAINQAIIDTAMLQTSTLRRVSVQFDKTPSEFESRNLYNKARREYFSKAFHSLRSDFNSQLQSIVKKMNSALPSKK